MLFMFSHHQFKKQKSKKKLKKNTDLLQHCSCVPDSCTESQRMDPCPLKSKQNREKLKKEPIKKFTGTVWWKKKNGKNWAKKREKERVRTNCICICKPFGINQLHLQDPLRHSLSLSLSLSLSVSWVYQRQQETHALYHKLEIYKGSLVGGGTPPQMNKSSELTTSHPPRARGSFPSLLINLANHR